MRVDPRREASPPFRNLPPGPGAPAKPALEPRSTASYSGMRVGSVALVGAGPGDPGLITVRGLELLRRADVVVYDRLVDRRLLAEAPRARRIFAGKASRAHALPQEQINALLVRHARARRLGAGGGDAGGARPLGKHRLAGNGRRHARRHRREGAPRAAGAAGRDGDRRGRRAAGAPRMVRRAGTADRSGTMSSELSAPIGILDEHPEWSARLIAELERRRLPFEKIDHSNHGYDPPNPRRRYAVVVNRTSPSSHRRGHASVLFYAEALLSHYESLGIPVINPVAAYRFEKSKALQVELFERLGLPYPR